MPGPLQQHGEVSQAVQRRSGFGEILADGKGRAVATEVLVPTPAVRNLIREGKTHQIYSALQTGGSHGMQTMDSALAELARNHVITREIAEARSGQPEELRRLMGTVRAA